MGDPDPDIDAVVSMRADDPAPAVPNSEIRDCDRCDADVYASPATCQAVADGIAPDRFLCIRCAVAEAEAEEDPESEAATEGDDGGE